MNKLIIVLLTIYGVYCATINVNREQFTQEIQPRDDGTGGNGGNGGYCVNGFEANCHIT
jgi:hypothetical protein